MIDLKDFMVETLRQFIEGINAARQELNDASGFKIASFLQTGRVEVSPLIDTTGEAHAIASAFAPNLTSSFIGMTPDEKQNVLAIEFDVNVTYTQESGGKMKIGVVGFGGEAGTSSADMQSNRIKFIVPVTIPN